MSLLFGGGYGLWTLIGHLLQKPTSLSFKGIISVAVLALLPAVISLSKDNREKVRLLPGIKSDYLRQNTSVVLKAHEVSKAEIENAIYAVWINQQMFAKEYEEVKYAVYRSQTGEGDLDTKKTRDNKNRIIIEVDYDYKNRGDIYIVVHKENQYIELSNIENELVLKMIIDGLLSVKKGKLTLASP